MLFNKEKKYLLPPVSGAGNYVRHVKLRVKLPENIILCPVAGLTETVEKKYKTKRVIVDGAPVYVFEKYNCAFATGFGIGAPALACTMEILIALGAKNFILTGYAGSLQKKINAGDIVICSGAVRDEGVSSCYIPPGHFSYPDKNLTAGLKSVFEKNKTAYHDGPTWTTDVIFRETAEEIKHYQNAGIYTVEMEAAAAFAIAKHYKTKCAALFAVSDILADMKWEPSFGHEKISAAMKTILKTILEIFEK